jgi:hypothetical protein
LNLKNKKVEDKIYKCLIDSINNHFFFEDIIPAKNRKEIINRFKSDKEASFYLTHKLSLSKNTISINLQYEIAHSNGYDSWGEQFVFNAKTLGTLIKEVVIEKVDHRNLNMDVDFMQGVFTSAENLAIGIWNQLKEPIAAHGASLHSVKLIETKSIYVEYFGE